MTVFLGIRHLSPNGAYNIIKKLDELKPKKVLIEAPSNLNNFINEIQNSNIEPPFAILSYTTKKPIKTILLPFAEYSPEYQAIIWCGKNNVECEFIDLPTDIVLKEDKDNKEEDVEDIGSKDNKEKDAEDIGSKDNKEKDAEDIGSKDNKEKDAEDIGSKDNKEEDAEDIGSKDNKEEDAEDKNNKEENNNKPDISILEDINIYNELDKKLGYGGHEAWWQDKIEYLDNNKYDYFEIVNEFGAELRKSEINNNKNIKNILRETYMKCKINQAFQKVITSNSDKSDKNSKIAVIVGAYHVDGLKDFKDFSFDKSFDKNKNIININNTLMPYSYFKLSSQAGYGAGNKAPEYYHMIWEQINKNNINKYNIDDIANIYLSKIAVQMRLEGYNISSAQVIEAVLLAKSLADLNNRIYPILCDLQDAILTCFAEGNLATIIKSRTSVEIGTRIGYLPQGVSNTSIQQDFNNIILDLKLKNYLDISEKEIVLDLRENIHVKNQELAFIDLRRSFFFNQLRVLNINYCNLYKSAQKNSSNSTWKEVWHLKWSTEIEIELVEASLIAETIEKAVIDVMYKNLENDLSITNITKNIQESFLCGISSTLNKFIVLLQTSIIENTNFEEFVEGIQNLLIVIKYGSLRKISTSEVIEILKHLYLKAGINLSNSTSCSDEQVSKITRYIDVINSMIIEFEFIDSILWLKALEELSNDIHANQFLSGYATATLLEKGYLNQENLENKLVFYLSSGMESTKSANWLEGLCMKNHYQLILNLNFWKYIDEYIKTLDDNEFKRIVLFLRRAFTNFTSDEKNSIGENLKELWLEKNVENINNINIKNNIKKYFMNLDEFDFENI